MQQNFHSFKIQTEFQSRNTQNVNVESFDLMTGEIVFINTNRNYFL